MAKLIVLTPDGSIADIFLIPDTLALELRTILQYSNHKSLNLASLRNIKLQVLSIVFKILKNNNIQINDVQKLEAFAISNINSFDSLLDIILRIEKLPNPNSLIIRLSK